MGKEKFFSTGQLAEMAGISARTLQYYDEQNILNPSKIENGRRWYTGGDIVRLEQILFFKSFGFSLKEIKTKIMGTKTGGDCRKIFLHQRKVLTEQIKNLKHTVGILDAAILEVKDGCDIDMNRLILIMESMERGNPYTFVVRYFTDDQLKNYAVRLLTSSDSPDSVRDIFDCLDKLYLQGADPAGREGQELAERWWNMVIQFAGGDFSLIRSLLYVGKDIRNWPESTDVLKKPIENFLAQAFSIYLERNGIIIDDADGKSAE
jgi:MerR family transcriptional regulator, thiopeptide resistance regulator